MEEIELLDEAPDQIQRPLEVIKGKAYITTWIWANVPTQKREGKKTITKRTRMEIPVVLRDDGTFWKDVNRPEFPAIMRIRQRPTRDYKLLSPAGLTAYTLDYKPDILETYAVMTKMVDYYIDWACSLGEQEEMTHFLALHALSSWFLPAFSAIGYIWMTGDKGSGKSHVICVSSGLGHMGKAFLQGTSYAAIRETSAAGCLMGFDDTDELYDPKKVDPDKRALMLSGYKKGLAIVSYMEMDENKKWWQRDIDAFAVRLFSSTKLPDPTLGSRIIILPMSKTLDQAKGNRDPEDPLLWPCDYRKLIDDLWIIALDNVIGMREYWNAAGEDIDIWGRDIEPWKAIFAVAKWLDDQGADNLLDKMHKLAMGYQKEKQELIIWDREAIVARAVVEVSCRYLPFLPLYIKKEVSTHEITEEAKRIAIIEDLDPEHYNVRSIGWRLRTRLGLHRSDRRDKEGKRAWGISGLDLRRLISQYSLVDKVDKEKINILYIGDAEKRPKRRKTPSEIISTVLANDEKSMTEKTVKNGREENAPKKKKKKGRDMRSSAFIEDRPIAFRDDN